jgi:hypothetical protein
MQFAPAVPGLRAAPLTLTSTAGSIASVALTGIGNGAGGTIDPAVSATIGASLTPRGVAVDSAQNVYVSDSSSGSVFKYASGATSPATLAAGFTTPSGIAVDAAGSVYVADPGAGQVKRISAGGTVTSVGSNLTTPTGIAVDLNGNIYIADSSQSSIIEVSSTLTAQVTIGSGFSAPASVAVDSSFNVYVADPAAGEVTKISAAGVMTQLTTGASIPTAVAVDAAGNLYVTDAATLSVILVPASGASPVAINSNLITPRAIAVDGAGNLYIADSGMTNVVELKRTQGLLSLPNTSTPLTASLTNIGNLPITPTGSGFTQTDSTDFNLAASGVGGCNFGNAIASGALCTLSATFTPQTSGNLSDTVTFTGNYSNVTLANPQSLQLTLTGTNSSTTVIVAVSPSNAQIQVDGTTYTGTQTFQFAPGSMHTLTAPSPQVISSNTQLIWSNWSNGATTASQTITVPSSAVTYTATFLTQYLITANASPSAGGSIIGAGWYNSGTQATLTATAASGYNFVSYSGGISSTLNPLSFTVTGPLSIVANFSSPSPALAVAIGTRTPGSGGTLNVTVVLTNQGSGTAYNAQITGVTSAVVQAGSGSVTVASSLPAPSPGVQLAPGASTNVPVTFNWPSTATRVAITFTVTATNAAGTVSYPVTQTVAAFY